MASTLPLSQGFAGPLSDSNQDAENLPVTQVLANATDFAIGTVNSAGRDMDSSTTGITRSKVINYGTILVNCPTPPSLTHGEERCEKNLQQGAPSNDTPGLLPRTHNWVAWNLYQFFARILSPRTQPLQAGKEGGNIGSSIEEADFYSTPLEESDVPSRSSLPSYSELYVRSLLSEHGLPCWHPAPHRAKPDVEPRAVVPGDVGIYSLGGCFKTIFNLWEDEEAIRELSRTCSQGPFVPLEGTVTTEPALREGEVIASDSASCKSHFQSPSDEISIVYEFDYPETPAGAILAVLSPANLEATDNNEAMQNFILQHAEAIFRLADRLRPVGERESLYIITGCIKSDLWAMAAYRELPKREVRQERVLQLGRSTLGTPDLNRPAASYKWTRQPRLSRGRLGDSGVQGRKDQSLFLQGFKMGFSSPFRSRMKKTPPNVPGPTSKDAESENHDKPPGNHDKPDPASGEPPPKGGDEQRHPGPSGPGGSNLSFIGTGSKPDSQMDEPVDSVAQFPHFPENLYHPCDVINQLLLQTTGAYVALSHDDDWRHVLRELMEASTEPASLLLGNHGSSSQGNDTITGSSPTMNLAIQHLIDKNAAPVVQDGVAFLAPKVLSGGAEKTSETNMPHFELFKPGFIAVGGDFVQSDIDHLAAETKGAKLLEVGCLLKIIPPDQIKLEPTSGSSDNAPVYHSFASGGYADIYKATMTCDDGSTKMVAVKVFRGAHLDTNTDSEKELYKNRLRREYDVWGRTEHRNVLRLEGLVCDILPSPGLVSEYKEHGDLLRFMQQGPTFDRLAMARDIACGLQYLHAHNVVHGDLTLLNVLVDVDRATGLYFPLITDFGKSRIHEMNGYTTNMNTTPMAARPPELLAHADPEPTTNKSALSFGSDVYSFSLLLLQVLTDKVPYKQEGVPLYILISQITDEQSPLRPTPTHYPLLNKSHDFCWPIMQACWKHNPNERITSREAYERLCVGSSWQGATTDADEVE